MHRLLPKPKNPNYLYIPDESENIENYVEFYLSLYYGFDDIYHPCLLVSLEDEADGYPF